MKRDPYWDRPGSLPEQMWWQIQIAWRNFPLNPMGFYRTMSYFVAWYDDEDEQPTDLDMMYTLLYLDVVLVARVIVPAGTPVGIVPSTIAITSGLRGASVFAAPAMFLGVLNTARQLSMFQTTPVIN